MIVIQYMESRTIKRSKRSEPIELVKIVNFGRCNDSLYL